MLFFVLLILLLMAPSASARLRGCRADPIVTLSNGRVVRMTTELAVEADDVEMITYTLHVPAGTGVRNIAYTGGELAGKEKVFVEYDLAAGNYTTETVATVPGQRVEVRAISQAGGQKQVVPGFSGDVLRAQFELPW